MTPSETAFIHSPVFPANEEKVHRSRIRRM
jgi:hypothetical protein